MDEGKPDDMLVARALFVLAAVCASWSGAF